MDHTTTISITHIALFAFVERLMIASTITRNGLLVVILTISVPAGATARILQDNYDRLERAANLIRQGNLSGAETELNIVLRKLPRDANALNLLGVVRAQQQRSLEAEKLFLSAIHQSPRLSGPYINLGRLYSEQKKTERAIWAFSQAATFAPGNLDVQSQLASLYGGAGDFEKALFHLEKIPQTSWRTEEFYLATKSYLALRENRKALETISSLKSVPLDADQAAAFSALLLQSSLPDEAISILQDAQQRYPNSFHLLTQLGASYAAKKQWAKAEEYYLSALRLNSSSIAALRELANVARSSRDFEKELAYLVQARKLAPEEPAVLYDFAVAAFRMNLILDALPVAKKLYKQKPDEPAYLHLLAVCRFRHDEKEEAEKLLRRYIQLRPQDSLGHYLLGITLYTVKRYSDARESFQKSLAVGNNADSEYMLGLIAQTEGDKASAVRWLERIKPTCSCYAAAQTLLGTVYAEQNNTSAARIALEHAVQLNPKDLRAHYQLGLVYSKLGEKEQARQMFAIADRLREEQRDEEVITFKLIDPPR